MNGLFFDRFEAGRLLAQHLQQYKYRSIVLALPRGGVVVGYEVARALHIVLGVVIVRKLGVPWQKELGMGAVAEGGYVYIDREQTCRLGIGEDMIDEVRHVEEQEVKRRSILYRQSHPLQNISGQTVVLIDDGVATGATMFVAIQAVKKQKPKLLVVAVPVCVTEIADQICKKGDKLVCLHEVQDMQAIGVFYQNFTQVTDEEVTVLLRKNREEIQSKRSAKLPPHLVAM